MDQYNKICDYLQEAVNMGTMTEEDAAVFESMAAKKYDVQGGFIEESVDDDLFEDAHIVDTDFMESVLDELILAYEAADTTDKATLNSYVSTMKELAGVYKNNIKSAKSSVKHSNYKEAKKQLADAKKALKEAEVKTIAYKDSMPGTVCKILVNLWEADIILKGLAGAVVAVGAGALGSAAVNAIAEDDDEIKKEGNKAVKGVAGSAIATGTAMTILGNHFAKKSHKTSQETDSSDLGKRNILNKIKKQRAAIEKIEKLIEKKEAKSK